MKFPVDITIKTQKILDNPIDGQSTTESNQSTVVGSMKTIKRGFSIRFSEKEEQSYITTIVNMIDGGIVLMNRGGGANMVFENGKTHTCVFDSGFMPMEIRVRTNQMMNTISAQGGTLDVDYTVDIIGNRAEKTHLTLSVKPSMSRYIS